MERTNDDWAVGESERWLSVIAGGMLGLAALRRGSLGGLLLGTVAGFMIHRGVTGHCVAGEVLFGELEDGGVATPPGEDVTASGHDVDAPDASDRVDEASRESFPASDAPAWTPTTRVEPGDEG